MIYESRLIKIVVQIAYLTVWILHNHSQSSLLYVAKHHVEKSKEICPVLDSFNNLFIHFFIAHIAIVVVPRLKCTLTCLTKINARKESHY